LETGALPIELLAFSIAGCGLWIVDSLLNSRALNPQSSIHNPQLFRLSMRDVFPAEPAVFAQLEPLGRLLLVLRRAVVPAFALGAGQSNDVAHT
jgi:hypothetical protein